MTRSMISIHSVPPREHEAMSTPSNELDPDRHKKNGVDKLTEHAINIYTGQPIIRELHVREIYNPE